MTRIIKVTVFLLSFLITREIRTATFIVNSTADSGAGTLRQAITDSNGTPGSNIINFNVGAGATITVTSANLPIINVPVNINGTTNAGGRVTIRGSAGANIGFNIGSGGAGSIIQGLAITNFSGAGIRLNLTSNCSIRNNYIGVNASGTIAIANGNGITVQGGSTNTIGGSVSNRNIISGNTNNGITANLNVAGITGLNISNNYIGTDVSGTFAIPNGNGINIPFQASASIASNVISGNSGTGIISTDTSSVFTISNNLIGTNSTGLFPIPNTIGIDISTMTNGTISGNTVSANRSDGILLDDCTTTIVEGNLIGVGSDGTSQLGNGGWGINLINATLRTRIGGTAAGTSNTIANNVNGGVQVNGSSTVSNHLLSNKIFNNNAKGIVLTNTGNRNQQPPTLTRACLNGTTLTITGTAPSIAFGGSLRIQFFENNVINKVNAGTQYINGDLTGIAGGANFTATIAGFTPSFSPDYISATATSSGSVVNIFDTSSFSTSIPIFSATISPNIQFVCQGETLRFTATVLGGTGPFTFVWNGPNGFSQNTGNNPTLIISNVTTLNTGNYTVTVTDNAVGGCPPITSSPAQAVVKSTNC